jgi:hypothetical protein
MPSWVVTTVRLDSHFQALQSREEEGNRSRAKGERGARRDSAVSCRGRSHLTVEKSSEGRPTRWRPRSGLMIVD